MKLTNCIRDAFIRAAMNDVPKTDYGEQARKIILADSIDQLPIKIRPLARSVETQQFVHAGTWWGRTKNLGTMTVYEARGKSFTPSAEVLAQIGALDEAAGAQEEQRNNLRSKLKSVAYSVSTRKALVDALPEFEKYLPEDQASAQRSVPVVVNVVADFVKAGWPKGAKKKAA